MQLLEDARSGDRGAISHERRSAAQTFSEGSFIERLEGQDQATTEMNAFYSRKYARPSDEPRFLKNNTKHFDLSMMFQQNPSLPKKSKLLSPIAAPARLRDMTLFATHPFAASLRGTLQGSWSSSSTKLFAVISLFHRIGLEVSYAVCSSATVPANPRISDPHP